MQAQIVAADAELSRWLTWVSTPTRAVRWVVKGETWELRENHWCKRVMVPEVHEMVNAAGRSPDLALDADEVTAGDRLRPSQGDVDDAMRGLEPTLVPDADGGTRVDYANVPLKNADGTMSKYAKRLIDLHSPAAAKDADISAGIGEKVAVMNQRRADEAAG